MRDRHPLGRRGVPRHYATYCRLALSGTARTRPFVEPTISPGIVARARLKLSQIMKSLPDDTKIFFEHVTAPQSKLKFCQTMRFMHEEIAGASLPVFTCD